MPPASKQNTSPSPSSVSGVSGEYVYPHPVVICTLSDDLLRQTLSKENKLEGILIGGLTTENLGIEQILLFLLAQPQVRYLVLCGVDGENAIGHRAGHSFSALFENGLDAETGRIIGAEGKRPYIKNLLPQAVEHVRTHVQAVNLIGCQDAETIIGTILPLLEESSSKTPPVSFFETHAHAEYPITGLEGDETLPLICDPNGYFLVWVEPVEQYLVVEHFTNQGRRTARIRGKTPKAVYMRLCEASLSKEFGGGKLLSRLDHAAYLGLELSCAYQAMISGKPYVQDNPQSP